MARLIRWTSSAWSFILGGCVVLLLAGHLLPWAAHQTAALTLSANDLAYFTHFTPGAGIFKNEWFYMPVWMAALLLGVLAAGAPGLGRLVLLGVGWATAGFGLPRYEQWAQWISGAVSLRQWEFGLQLMVSLAVMGLVLILALAGPGAAHRWPRAAAVLNAAIAGGAGLMCAVPLAGYLSVRPALETLYGQSVGLGLGWWITLGAVLMLWAAAFVKIAPARLGSD